MTILFILACVVALASAIYLTVTRTYATGLPGSIGLGLIALATITYLIQWFFGIDYESLPQPKIVVIGIAVFLMQHVFRVVKKTKGDRRKRLDSGGFGCGRKTDVKIKYGPL